MYYLDKLQFMKTTFLLAVHTMFALITFGQITEIRGKIGPYNIEMFLEKGSEVNSISGKYNYKGKTSSLSITGELLDDVMHLEESYNASPTGDFYLQITGDSLTGKWVMNTKSYDVRLAITNEVYDCLDYFSVQERSELVSPSINGTYEIEFYFLNDMWFEEGKPEIEIGFNGGTAVIETINEDSLRFVVDVICGPTYHVAYAEGFAVRNYDENNTYVYLSEDGCEITITLDVKEVSMTANAGFECGFGVRAYLDHSFIKVSDEVDFDLGY